MHYCHTTDVHTLNKDTVLDNWVYDVTMLLIYNAFYLMGYFNSSLFLVLFYY